MLANGQSNADGFGLESLFRDEEARNGDRQRREAEGPIARGEAGVRTRRIGNECPGNRDIRMIADGQASVQRRCGGVIRRPGVQRILMRNIADAADEGGGEDGDDVRAKREVHRRQNTEGRAQRQSPTVPSQTQFCMISPEQSTERFPNLQKQARPLSRPPNTTTDCTDSHRGTALEAEHG